MTSNLQHIYEPLCYSVLEKLSYNKNIQVEGLNSEEHKKILGRNVTVRYALLTLFTFVKFLCVAYVTLCHRSIKIIT